MRIPFATTLILLLLPQVSDAEFMTGDIVIIGLSGRSTDEFSWVPMVDIAAGEQFYFTDHSFITSTGDFAADSGFDWLMRYTAPAGGVSAGTVQTVIDGSEGADYTFLTPSGWGSVGTTSISLSALGDPLYAFQTSESPSDTNFGIVNSTSLFAVTNRTTDWGAYTGGETASQHNLPPGLTDGVNAVAAGAGPGDGDEFDNVRYIGPTAGTAEELLASIANANNWQGIDGTVPGGWTSASALNFTVTSSTVPEPSSLALCLIGGIAAGGCYLRQRRVVEAEIGGKTKR